MNNTKETWRERYNELFGKNGDLAKFLCIKYGTNIFHSKLENLITDFIQSEIDRAVKEERERIKQEYIDTVPSN